MMVATRRRKQTTSSLHMATFTTFSVDVMQRNRAAKTKEGGSTEERFDSLPSRFRRSQHRNVHKEQIRRAHLFVNTSFIFVKSYPLCLTLQRVQTATGNR